jgi:hypothetical protein
LGIRHPTLDHPALAVAGESVGDSQMSGILKVVTDHLIKDHPTYWLILDCGHWFHWTGAKMHNVNEDFPCPSCEPPIVVRKFPEPDPDVKA